MNKNKAKYGFLIILVYVFFFEKKIHKLKLLSISAMFFLNRGKKYLLV